MMKKIRKRNKILIIVLTIILIGIIASGYYKFSTSTSKTEDSTSVSKNEDSTKDDSLKLTEKSKQEYRKVGDKALGGAKDNLNAKQKESIKYEAIYQAIYNDKASKMIDGLQISEAEALNYINKQDSNVLTKVVIFDNDEKDYVLSNSSLAKLDDKKLADSYVGHKVKEVRIPTNDEKILIAKREIASNLVVDEIVKETNEVLNNDNTGEVK